MDRTQVLKRLPSNNRDPGGEGTAAALNESVMSFLESNCGLNQTPNQTARKRGKKISPGQAITSLATSGAAASATTSTTTAVNDDDEQWICSCCNKTWEEDGDDRWIVCLVCRKQYHLQCSGVEYETRDYYTLDIESINFKCDAC